jgi:hypothetical protein
MAPITLSASNVQYTLVLTDRVSNGIASQMDGCLEAVIRNRLGKA